MKRQYILGLATLAGGMALAAAWNVVWIPSNNGVTVGIDPQQVSSISYNDDKSQVVARLTDEVTEHAVDMDSPLTLTFGQTEGTIEVNFSLDGVNVMNPYAYDEATPVAVNVADNHVVIDCGTLDAKITVTGTTGNGQLRVYGDGKVTVTLSDATITNQTGSALNLQTTSAATVKLVGVNTLTDSEEYVTPEGEKEKGTLYSAKKLSIDGKGELRISSVAHHALCCNKELTLKGGTVTVTSSGNDGIHADGVVVKGASVYVSGTAGDAIDADKETLTVSSGYVEVAMTSEDTKGLKADGDIHLDGGTIVINNSASQGKSIKSKANIYVDGADISSTTSADAVVIDGDPSYCTSFKADKNIYVNSGEITIVGTGKGNKGLSSDSLLNVAGGNININLKGDGAVYTNTSGANDSYCSTCIGTDGDAMITGGTLVLTNAGSAGKCIKADGSLVIGEEGTEGPSITATTTGKRFTESSGTSSGGGNWGRPGGGFDQGADYANPKVVKAAGDLTVNSGTLRLSASAEGGEGLESKTTLTINGGDLYITTYDDCINASNHIQINGGVVNCQATGNDAIDSNGTLTVAGGVVIAVGAKSPECGFDCDNNRFAVTGGYMIGLGGSTSNPTASACTQRVVSYGGSFTNGTLYTVTAPDGSQIISFKSPVTISGRMLISAPGISTGTHTIYTGGTLTGGTECYGVTYGAEYTPGTKATTFSPSSMVTSVGTSSGSGNRP